MKEIFHPMLAFLSNLSAVKIDEEMGGKPSSSLKPVPNTNLFNSVLLWSLASAFGLQGILVKLPCGLCGLHRWQLLPRDITYV